MPELISKDAVLGTTFTRGVKDTWDTRAARVCWVKGLIPGPYAALHATTVVFADLTTLHPGWPNLPIQTIHAELVGSPTTARVVAYYAKRRIIVPSDPPTEPGVVEVPYYTRPTNSAGEISLDEWHRPKPSNNRFKKDGKVTTYDRTSAIIAFFLKTTLNYSPILSVSGYVNAINSDSLNYGPIACPPYTVKFTAPWTKPRDLDAAGAEWDVIYTMLWKPDRWEHQEYDLETDTVTWAIDWIALPFNGFPPMS